MALELRSQHYKRLKSYEVFSQCVIFRLFSFSFLNSSEKGWFKCLYTYIPSYGYTDPKSYSYSGEKPSWYAYVRERTYIPVSRRSFFFLSPCIFSLHSSTTTAEEASIQNVKKEGEESNFTLDQTNRICKKGKAGRGEYGLLPCPPTQPSIRSLFKRLDRQNNCTINQGFIWVSTYASE